MGPEQVDAKVDRLLLDTNFEGYKLALDPIPVLHKEAGASLHRLLPSDSQWSYQHVRIFAQDNCVITDKTHTQDIIKIYFWIKQVQFILLKTVHYDINLRNWSDPVEVLKLEIGDIGRDDRYNARVCFASKDCAVVSDGYSKLYICQTGDRNENTPWKILHSACDICDVSFWLADAQIKDNIVYCVVEYVTEKSKAEGQGRGDQGSNFILNMKWIKFSECESIYTKSTSTFECDGNVEFTCLTNDGATIACLTTKPLKCIEIDGKHVVDQSSEYENEATKSRYSWGQTIEDVCAVFAMDDVITKDDVTMQLSSEHVTLKVRGHMLIEGQLAGVIDVEASHWIIHDANRLDVTFQKLHPNEMWSEVVIGDNSGEFVPDPKLVSQVVNTLRHITQEEGQPDTPKPAPNFNMDQLEECDVGGESLTLYWLQPQQNVISHQCDLSGSQVLFSDCSRICMRYDVDAILWQVKGQSLTHEHTFNAFGYVQAGKERRKYSVCSPDARFACIVEMNKHAFVYWQPQDIETNLRHRTSGRQVSKIAKTQLISLPDANAQICGVAAFNQAIVLICDNNIHVALLHSSNNQTLV